MKVPCDCSYVQREGDFAMSIPSVDVTCRRCGAEETAYGQHEASVRRCLAALNEQCPREENNFYEVDR